jgi:translation initiation factor eIF-2B subunit delta
LKRLPAEVLAVVDRVRRDRWSGASQLTLLSLEALKLASEKLEATDHREFMEKLRLVGCLLSEAKPSMVSIANMAGKLLLKLEKAKLQDLWNARRTAVNLSLRLAEEYREALERAALEASKLMVGVQAVATCSYSSLILKAFKAAAERGLSFKVLIAESRVKGISHGVNLAGKVSNIGLNVGVFPDDKLNEMVRKGSLVLLGADAVLPDGSIINGMPSLKLAVEAQSQGKPVYVACDSTKISPSSMKPDEGFDLVPSKLVKALIIEKGKINLKMIRKTALEVKGLRRAFNGVKS